MPRKSKREVLADRQDAAQRALFDEKMFPAAMGVLDSIQLRRYEHKGVRLLEDDVRAMRLVELFCMKWSIRAIAREMQISTHTLYAARRALASQGKLATYKQRIAESIEDGCEAGAARWRDGIENGIIAAGQIPVGFGIMSDKRSLLLGEPTSIRGSVEMSDAMRVETINAYLDVHPLPLLIVSEVGTDSQAIDLASTDALNKPQQIAINPPLVTTLVATSDDQSPSVHPSIHPDADGRTTTSHPSDHEGGGGGQDGRAVDGLDPLG